MSDYISREALIDRLNNNLSACNHGTFSEMCYADAIETVKNLPAADVEPVRHGREIEDGDIGGFWLCSLCGEWLPYGANYCPSCGARMDGESE